MKQYVQIALLVQLVTWLSIGLNITVLKQGFGFVYLTIIPGYVILRALRIESKSVDMILLSVGLSLTVLMLVGLAMCGLLPFAGLTKPLSLAPLVLAISGVVSGILLTGCRHDLTCGDHNIKPSSGKLNISYVLLCAIPAFGIIGALYNNVFILLVMIVTIAAFFAFGYSSRIANRRYHILIILAISVALIFHTSFISRYLIGDDIHVEAYVFKETENKGYWVSPGVGVDTDFARIKSVLSITILPTIYSVVLDFEMETIFKILYPVIFSLVPLVLYRIYKTQTNGTIALISVFFFMSSVTFFGIEPLAVARQIIAELLLVLSLFLLFEKDIPTNSKRILLVILGAGLIVSHYALAYLYIFLVVISFVVLRNWRRRDVLDASLVLLLFTMNFTWYLYVSDAPLVKIAHDVERIRNNFMRDIYDPSSRSAQVATLVSAPPTIVSVIHRFVFLVQNFFIVVGVMALQLRRKKVGFDSKFRLASLVALFILVICIAVPEVAGTFNFTRFYAMAMIFLAPFFALGGEVTFNGIEKFTSGIITRISRSHSQGSHKTLILQLISIVLVVSFLFSIGFIEHVTGTYPESWSLDKDQKKTSKDVSIRASYYTEILSEQDVFGTNWLFTHMGRNGIVYSGAINPGVSYSILSLPEHVRSIYEFTGARTGTYAYLNTVITDDDLISGPLGLLNITELSPSLASSNKIYSNGASESYSPAG